MTLDKTHKFPNDPVLVKLLTAAKQFSTSETVIHDVREFEKTHPELLHDILQTRRLLYSRLPLDAVSERGILREGHQHVCILTRGGYEFIVAFFAVRAIGGVCVPLASGILPADAQYLISKVKSTSLLSSNERSEKASEICALMKASGTAKSFTSIPIASDGKPQGMVKVEIDGALEMKPAEPGCILFTSGTTGRPKGVALPRQALTDFPPADRSCTAITYRPVHWIGGIATLIGSLIAGRKLHVLGEEATAADMLNAFRNNYITDAAFCPMRLRQMQDVLTKETGELSENEREKYARYFKGLSTIKCTTAIIDPSTKRFWKDLTGLPFLNIYAATELGGLGTRGVSEIKGSIGLPPPGVEVKLSEGTHGEILIKSPNMILHYVDDEKKTQAAFDEEGYFRTGDLAEFRDGEYVFAGRENNDFVTYGAYKFSTPQVEIGLRSLPYISEAVVLAVPNHSAKHLCGAIIQLRPGAMSSVQVTLARIRSDLGDSLADYMIPTLLRILSTGERLPYTVSGKPIKRQILKDYFGSADGLPPKFMPREVEFCSLRKLSAVETRAWDRCGLQLAD